MRAALNERAAAAPTPRRFACVLQAPVTTQQQQQQQQV
jgi:hypothetical protein